MLVRFQHQFVGSYIMLQKYEVGTQITQVPLDSDDHLQK